MKNVTFVYALIEGARTSWFSDLCSASRRLLNLRENKRNPGAHVFTREIWTLDWTAEAEVL
jgi:hypothetical protein